jgi:hypothetical protein
LAVIPVSAAAAGSGCGAGESAPGFDGSAMRLSLLVMPVVAKRLASSGYGEARCFAHVLRVVGKVSL